VVRLVAGIAVALLALLIPVASQAGYLIRLKNGKEFVVSSYWREGDRILFNTHGGMMGVEKDLVARIEESDRPVKTYSAPALSPKPAEEKLEVQKSQTKTATTSDKQANEPKVTKPKDQQVIKEFQSLQERFGGLNDLSNSEVYRLHDDLDFFKRKLASSNQLDSHGEEFSAANTLQSAIDGLLRARGLRP
jgi:hypothetical protein